MSMMSSVRRSDRRRSAPADLPAAIRPAPFKRLDEQLARLKGIRGPSIHLGASQEFGADGYCATDRRRCGRPT